MSTFLQLCQAVAADCGVAGSDTADVPITTIGQHGELGRIVRWVNEAWLEIQAGRRYSFMLDVNMPLVIPAGTNHVAGGVEANRYDPGLTYHVPYGSNASEYLDWLPWQIFQQSYDVPYLTGARQPTAWAIRPTDRHIVLNAYPEADTTIYVTRFRTPTKLVGDAAEPTLPEDLQQLIIEKAKVRYANFDEAGVMRQTATAEVNRLEADLRERCLPPITFGGNLLDA